MDAYVKAGNRLRRARGAAGADGLALKKFFSDVLDASGCRDQLDGAVAAELSHRREEQQVQQDTIHVADLFAPFESMYLFVLAPSTQGQRLRYDGEGARTLKLDGPRDAVVTKWLQWRGLTDHANAVSNYMIRAIGTYDTNVFTTRVFPVDKDPKNIIWEIFFAYQNASYSSFMMFGVDLPVGYQSPLDTQVNYADLTAQTQLLTAFAAQIVSGAEAIEEETSSGTIQKRWFSDMGGEVVAAGGANSILPNRRVPNALVVLKSMKADDYGLDIQMARSGVFRFPAARGNTYVDAYTVDRRTGRITSARDMGLEGQRYPNWFADDRHYAEPETRATLLLARLAPTDVFQLVGPDDQPVTLTVLDADSQGPLNEFAVAHDWERGATVFAKPGSRFYLTLKNYAHRRYYGRQYEGMFTRGFMMGYHGGIRAIASEGNTGSPARDDAHGPGYLAGIDHRVVFQEADVAVSMARLNRNRLTRQRQSGLADRVNLDLADKADRLVRSGLEALGQKRYSQAYRNLSTSAALSLRAYPDIRTAVADAVNGILVYMFLLVPFSFFAERLLIGARDIRGRIAGMFAMFLVAFLIIRFMHPAYDLVTSPMIVLVGFVIFMLCLLILSFISGKFAQRIAELRRAGGGATEADSDISRSAAAGAAFSLGINNMRKRKVRTAYTVATLVLVSFCLVCFTAPRPRLLEREIAVGPASYDGVLLEFERQNAGHTAATKARYGHQTHLVARRAHYQWSWRAYYTPPHARPRNSIIEGALYVQRDEPKVTGIDKLLIGGAWFDRDDERVCYLSDATAAELGIDPSIVSTQEVSILLAGWPIRVAGVFDSSALEALKDINGETLLPQGSGRFVGRKRAEERTKQAVGKAGVKAIQAHYIPAAKTVIFPLNVAEGGLCASFVLQFKDLPYGEMRNVIDQMMDTSPTFISYALDGLAYFGGKFRFTGLETLADVGVPLLIASFIVFSTMLGSVYERQKEISVYSAVGLSPRHVFYLFLAESLVYAIIGVVGGYLLALLLQGVSHQFGDILGLSINYSSRSAIYVTLILMIAVIVSSFLPARRAARIASPSERVSWVLPPDSGPGQLDFTLPFTYLGREAFAVIPFLTDWFDARGEDSSGEFSSSASQVGVVWVNGMPALTIAATVWLRPYDLGVSQRVRISIQPAEPHGTYVVAVQVHLLKGDLTSWHRTNAPFVAILRLHLLSWRAMSARRKQTLFDRGAHMLLPASGGSKSV